MALTIVTNMASLFAQKNMSADQAALANSMNRLSSGLRINSAKDDAAGLAISQQMGNDVRSFVVAERNTNDGVSMAQTAEGALGSISDVLGRMRELATQGANGSLSTTNRQYLETEFSQLQTEIKNLMSSVKFNGIKVINTAASVLNFQVGISNVTADRITITFGGLNLTSLLSPSNTVYPTATLARAAMGIIDTALINITTVRARYGAIMSRLDTRTATLQTMRLNITASRSRIRDVDVAEESANLSRGQVLAQGAAAILAQANQQPQLALTLLRGQ